MNMSSALSLLIKALSRYGGERFHGWRLGKAALRVGGDGKQGMDGLLPPDGSAVQTALTREMQKYAQLCSRLVDKCGTGMELTVLLLKPSLIGEIAGEATDERERPARLRPVALPSAGPPPAAPRPAGPYPAAPSRDENIWKIFTAPEIQAFLGWSGDD
ncbi:MAG: hypothetical protein LBT26_02760, partial [Clostridiales Family XIII bacterium]|nr:hypothetical protein [Clostridiales Family XIII bacterium]